MGLLSIGILHACTNDGPDKEIEALSTEVNSFEAVLPSESNIHFQNNIDDLGKYTPYNTYYIYNGGGVAAADINNDGLQDLLFSSNQHGCSLYLNKGDFVFEDITASAGITYADSWTTGISMVDINSDGWMDIYICRSGLKEDTTRSNLLYINQGDNTFKEQGEAYGLNDEGTSNQAYFFDFDRDGDLDAYVLNHPIDFENAYDPYYTVNIAKDSIFSNKFFVNENNVFRESNIALGLDYEKGFSLSAGISDINRDGWPDLYVANDFVSPDYLFINKEGKGFVEAIDDYFNHTSLFSMGSDFADINNDGIQDFFEADMATSDHFRRKNNEIRFPKAYHDLLATRIKTKQHSRNMLYLGSSEGKFKEIGEFSGVSRTDWSWTTLFEDLDNDGLKDLFITNGTKREFHDIDYISLKFDGDMIGAQYKHNADDLIRGMPITPLSNFAFKNVNGTSFKNMSEEWGLNAPINGQGATIADLNNDGWLDIIVNNTDTTSTIFRNNAGQDQQLNYFALRLSYQEGNINGLSSKVTIWTDGAAQFRELYTNRGFQSSLPPVLHFGIGQQDRIDSLVVQWPNGKIQTASDIKPNQTFPFAYDEAIAREPSIDKSSNSRGYSYLSFDPILTHEENIFDEFKRDKIQPYKLSNAGPVIATGDLNGNGLDDVILGGSSGKALQIYFQDDDGIFRKSFDADLDASKFGETSSILLLDIDNDTDLDLFVGNGSNDEIENDEFLRDLLFLNDGTGDFSLSLNALPDYFIDSKCLASDDVDGDGDPDIFVGGGYVPGSYGKAMPSALLINEQGRFTEESATYLNGMHDNGMLTDATFTDLNGDNKNELVVAGHWTPIMIFQNKDGVFHRVTLEGEMKLINGWWNDIKAKDLDMDGDIDLVASNYGLNNFIKASPEQPVELFAADFDDNNSMDPVLTHYLNDRRSTFVNRDQFCEKMPKFNNTFLTNRSFAEAELEEIIDMDRTDLIHSMAHTFESVIIENLGDLTFKIIPLEIHSQLGPMKTSVIMDYNNDGLDDLLTFGNSNSEFYDLGDNRSHHGYLYLHQGNENLEDCYTEVSQSFAIDEIVNSSAIVQVSDRKIPCIVLGVNDGQVISICPQEEAF